MQKTFVAVVVIGVGVGAMMPAREPQPPVAAVAATEASPSTPAYATKLDRKENGHFYAHATVNGHLVQFLVDTGATGVALTEEDARRVGLHFSPGEFKVVGRGVSSDVMGKVVTLDTVEIEGKRVNRVQGAIVQGADISLLGQSYLSRISAVEMSGDTMILR